MSAFDEPTLPGGRSAATHQNGVGEAKLSAHHLRAHRQPAAAAASALQSRDRNLGDQPLFDGDMMLEDHEEEEDEEDDDEDVAGRTAVARAGHGEPAAKRARDRSGNVEGGVLRRGKWLLEEQAYAEQIIHDFEEGLLPLRNGATLRAYLSGGLPLERGPSGTFTAVARSVRVIADTYHPHRARCQWESDARQITVYIALYPL
jgi:hypothetical protein